MRFTSIFVATLLLACAGRQAHVVTQAEPYDHGEFEGRDAANPDSPRDRTTYSTGIVIDERRPSSLISPTEGLVRAGDHFRIARWASDAGEAQAVDEGQERWPGPMVHARAPRFGEPVDGQQVFYLERTPGDLQSARAASWKLGTVTRHDPVLGMLVIDRDKIDPHNAVLLPLGEIPGK